MDAVIESNVIEVEALMKKVPRAFKANMADALDHSTRSFYKKFYEERLQGEPGVKGSRGGIFNRFQRQTIIEGKVVNLRTASKQRGASVAAISKSSDNPMEMKVEMFSKSEVARVQEKGGKITSKTAMPIPLNDTARAMKDLSRLKPMKINGVMFLGRKRNFGVSSKPELLFILKRSINIRPKLGFYKTWDEHQQRNNEIFSDAVNKTLQGL